MQHRTEELNLERLGINRLNDNDMEDIDPAEADILCARCASGGQGQVCQTWQRANRPSFARS